MKDPSRAPGYAFADLRLLRARYELAPEDKTLPADAKTGFNYRDEVQVTGRTVRVVQEGTVTIRTDGPPPRDLLKVEIGIEGVFEGGPEVNIAGREFGENHAPAILFPFLREFFHRLTSNMGALPPVLLPPFNVLALRQVKGTPYDSSSPTPRIREAGARGE